MVRGKTGCPDTLRVAASTLALVLAGCAAAADGGLPEGAAATPPPPSATVDETAFPPTEDGLPVFHLATSPDINDDVYTPATVIYLGRRYAAAEAQHRGQSSSVYRKRSYTLKFARNDLFRDAAAGMAEVGRRKLVLVSNFDDNSHLRYRLAYELWRRIGGPGRKVEVSTFSAVVYDNGRYQGVYTVTDHIDGDLMQAHGLSPAGNLYKGVGPQANFFRHVPVAWEKKEGAPPAGQPGALDDLEALRDFVADASDETFGREAAARLSLDDYRAWLILASAIQAHDTLGKNSYHHHEPTDGRWRVIPWDFNASFGQDWMTNREAPVVPVPHIAALNRLFQRLHDHPVLGPETRAAYQRALAEDIPVEVVLDLLDQLAGELALAVRHDQNHWREEYLSFSRWSARPDFTDFGGEVAYIRRWVRDRWALLQR
jgi:spore coat protein H